MAGIEDELRGFIRREFMADRPGMALDNDLPLIQLGIIDSLGVFLLVGFIEEQFGIKIQEEDVILENFATVHAIRNLVISRLSSAASN